MKRRIPVMILVMGMITLLLAGCTTEVKTATTAEISKTEEKEMKEVTLNEVAHSIFYAPLYVAVEEEYFEEEGIRLNLICGFGADKVMTAVLSGEADVGFMGSEASIYTYNEGAKDFVVNFAQLTQRAGNFLVARKADEDFAWTKLKGTEVLGGRKGGIHISM